MGIAVTVLKKLGLIKSTKEKGKYIKVYVKLLSQKYNTQHQQFSVKIKIICSKSNESM